MNEVINSTWFFLVLFVLVIGGLLYWQFRRWMKTFRRIVREIKQQD